LEHDAAPFLDVETEVDPIPFDQPFRVGRFKEHTANASDTFHIGLLKYARVAPAIAVVL
jgi:hypothetical protein